MATYVLQVNGQYSNLTIDDPSTPLLYVLEQNFQLNGPKFGCGLAQCGSCTVLLDGRPIRSCVTPVFNADGHSVTSLEGLRLIPIHYRADNRGVMRAELMRWVGKASSN